MVRYFKVLINKPSSVELMQEEFKKSIIFNYRIINTTSHLFLLKRIAHSKQELFKRLLNKGIIPISISNTKCNDVQKLYNVYFQSGSKIVVNNLNKIK